MWKKTKHVKKEIELAKRQTRIVKGTKYGSLSGGGHGGYHKGTALQRASLKKQSKKKHAD
jgi:hypothetical protein